MCTHLSAPWTKCFQNWDAITQWIRFTCNKQQSAGSFTSFISLTTPLSAFGSHTHTHTQSHTDMHSSALDNMSTAGHPPPTVSPSLLLPHIPSPSHLPPLLLHFIPSIPPSFGNLVEEQTNLQDWFGALMWQVSRKDLNKEFAISLSLSLSFSLIHFSSPSSPSATLLSLSLSLCLSATAGAAGP